MKIITPRVHGYLDYVTVVVFLLAPALLGLTGIPAMLAYALAVIHLLMTLVTDFPSGVGKLIPFTIHGWIERVVGPLLVLVSFIPGFATDTAAQVFYLVIGVVIILVGLLTDYQGTQ
ncbi:MAG: hypothetical protein ACREXU_10780 [Gammaproteobacteria bacterium]